MFDIYQKYTVQEIKDRIGWKDCINTNDLSTAIMVLCDIIAALQNKIDELEAAPQVRDDVTP